MTDVLKTIDPWFLNLLVLILGMYFLWSVKNIFKDLKDSIKDLKDLIKDLYEHRNDHEARLITLETKCKYMHGDEEFEPSRQSGGRRHYDPPTVPKGV
jgi:hypothetical protein